jgi:DNA polymerase/3'-5' exonuclease PolX
MKARYPLEIAEQIAARCIERLSPFCERIEIAGSIRRRKAEVGDIEIVAQPLPMFGLFGDQIGFQSLCLPYRATKNGPRYKQYALPEGINLDLFIVLPPAQWGVIFALRTGGEKFSQRLVTHRPYGYLPPEYFVSDGAVHRAYTGEIVPTPEEEDFLSLCGVAHIPPQERS